MGGFHVPLLFCPGSPTTFVKSPYLSLPGPAGGSAGVGNISNGAAIVNAYNRSKHAGPAQRIRTPEAQYCVPCDAERLGERNTEKTSAVLPDAAQAGKPEAGGSALVGPGRNGLAAFTGAGVADLFMSLIHTCELPLC